MTMVTDNLDSFDNIGVLQSGADAEFGGDLFVIFPFRLSRLSLAELFDSVNGPSVLRLALDEADGSSSAGSQDLAPLAVFLRHGGVSGIFETLTRRMMAACMFMADTIGMVVFVVVIVTMMAVLMCRGDWSVRPVGSIGTIRMLIVLIPVDLREAQNTTGSMLFGTWSGGAACLV